MLRMVFAFGALAVSCTGQSTDAQPEWTIEREILIGTIDGPVAFGRIVDLEVTASGEIIVMEFTAQNLKVVHPDGSPGWTIGRAGSGPGEFVAPTGMGWKGDTLWVTDADNNRISLFRFAKQHVGDISMTAAPSFSQSLMPPRAGPLLRDGSVFSIARLPSGFRSQRIVNQYPALKVSPSGEVQQTLFQLPAKSRQATVRLRTGHHVIIRKPVTDGTLHEVAFGGGSVVVVTRPADGARGVFRVTRIGLAGDTIADQTYEYVPMRLTEDLTRDIFRRLANSIARNYGISPRIVLEDLVENVDVPEFVPPVSSMIPGRDGSVWIQRESVPGTQPVWEILDYDLRRVARLEAPSGLRILRVSDSHVWGVVTDELDVPYIARYRIRK